MKLNNTIAWSELTRGYNWILCNNLNSADPNAECISGNEYWDDECEEPLDVYQTFLVDDSCARFILDHCPDVIVGYSEMLDCYYVDVTHYGTSWDYVYTAYKPIYDADCGGYRFATDDELRGDE